MEKNKPLGRAKRTVQKKSMNVHKVFEEAQLHWGLELIISHSRGSDTGFQAVSS